MGRQPQDVAFDGGLLGEVARWRRSSDDRIQCVAVLANAAHE
jgi:hypothetical protein